jgi:hypothetical protein
MKLPSVSRRMRNREGENRPIYTASPSRPLRALGIWTSNASWILEKLLDMRHLEESIGTPFEFSQSLELHISLSPAHLESLLQELGQSHDKM